MPAPNLLQTLTDGWGADDPTGDSLLRRFVDSRARRLTNLADANGGRTEAIEGAVLADSGSSFPLDNAVVLDRPPTPGRLEAVVDRANGFFGPGRAWTLLSVWPTGELSGCGLRLVGHPPLMLRPAGPSPVPALPAGGALRVVEGRRRRAHFEATLVAGYPLVPTGSFERITGDATRLFVAYRDGHPVAVAAAARGDGLGEIDWVATLPRARRRGFGIAVVTAALGACAGLPAVLVASDAGRPLYDRLGFLPLFRITIWERTP